LEKERECQHWRIRGGGRGRERVLSSMEPDVGLDLTTLSEIMT